MEHLSRMTDWKRPGHTKNGAALTELILEVFLTNGRLLRAGDKMMKDLQLTAARWQVIDALSEGPKTVAQVAREYELTRQGILWVVQSMRKDGLVELVENPDHRRAKLVKLTTKARDIEKVVSTRQVAWANELGKSYDHSQLLQTIKSLNEIGLHASSSRPANEISVPTGD